MKKNVTKKAMGMVKWFLPFYLFTFLPLSMMAQDDDDMYFVPTKKAVKKQQMTYGVPQNTYYAGCDRNVDEYNRRFQPEMIDTAMVDTLAQDYELTQKMSRWDGYEPSQSYWDGYADGRRDGAWHSPWFYSSLYPWYDSYWYDPWYMDRWYLYHGIYDPWYWGYGYYGYYGYTGWYSPWYYGYGYYGPYYPGYTVVSTGTTGSQNHGRINYNGPRGISNGRSTAYSSGTFGGSRMGTTNRNTTASGSLGSRNSATRTARTTTSTAGRTTNAYGNFGGNRARTATSNTTTNTRTYTPTTTTSSSSGSFGGSSSSSSSSGGGSFGGSRSGGGSIGGSRSGGGSFGGRR